MYKNRYRVLTISLLLWFIQFNAFAQEADDSSNRVAASSSSKTNEKSTWTFSGFASEEYRFRHSRNLELDDLDNSSEENVEDTETDNDLRLFLSGYLWDRSDHFAGDLSLGIWHDLDGAPDVGSPSSFSSIDEYSAPQSWHDPYDIYSLHGEYHSPNLLALMRAGRQNSEYGRPITFDGATVTFNLIKPYLDWTVFGGRTVHFFAMEDGLFENWLASTAVTVRLLQSLRIEMDYRYAVEKVATEVATEDDIDDDNIDDHCYGLAVFYEMNQWARFKGYIRGLNASISNAGSGARLEWVKGQLGVDADIDGQLTTLRTMNERDDPYFEVLGESLPHLKVSLDTWKAITTSFGSYGAHVGWQERVLTEDEPNRFNRDFGRIYLLLEASDVAVSGPFASLVVEYNYSYNNSDQDADTGNDSLFAIGGSVGYQRKPIKATAGSYYYRYKYDYYFDLVERADVRSTFVEFRYDPFEWISVRLKYTFEQFDRDLHIATLKFIETY